MQDLNVITKLNAEAVERDIPQQQANGKYVVAEYAGLHFIGYHLFDSEAEANKQAAEIGLQPSGRARVFNPTTATV